jgi:hypothetical protein
LIPSPSWSPHSKSPQSSIRPRSTKQTESSRFIGPASSARGSEACGRTCRGSNRRSTARMSNSSHAIGFIAASGNVGHLSVSPTTRGLRCSSLGARAAPVRSSRSAMLTISCASVRILIQTSLFQAAAWPPICAARSIQAPRRTGLRVEPLGASKAPMSTTKRSASRAQPVVGL